VQIPGASTRIRRAAPAMSSERGEMTAVGGEAKDDSQPQPQQLEAPLSPSAAMGKMSLDYAAPPGGMLPVPDAGMAAAAAGGGGRMAVGGGGLKRPPQLEFKEGPPQRLSTTPPRGERRRMSHSEVDTDTCAHEHARQWEGSRDRDGSESERASLRLCRCC